MCVSPSQAYTSVSRGGGLQLRDHKDLARHMNTVVFHTKMVDYLDELLRETSDLSLYWSVAQLAPSRYWSVAELAPSLYWSVMELTPTRMGLSTSCPSSGQSEY